MRTLRWGLALAVAFASVATTGVSAAPDAPAAAGSVYENARLGLKLSGPVGWQMSTAKDVATGWTRLVTFTDKTTGVDAVLSLRERTHSAIESLRDSVEREWSEDKTVSIQTRTIVPATAQAPVASAILEATQLVAPEPAKLAPGAVPPAPGTGAAPMPWNVSATLWLAPGSEYLLLVKARSTVWSRVRPMIDASRATFSVVAKESGPVGEGAYHDEVLGFTCRYPTGYSVRIPKAKGHVVEFKGLGAEAAVLGIYHFNAAFPVENDAQGLVKYYVEDQSGEATTQPLEVGGRSGWLVTARANVETKPTTVFIAVTKRGDNEFFRIRAAVPRDAEAKGRAAFEQFLTTLQIGPAPR